MSGMNRRSLCAGLLLCAALLLPAGCAGRGEGGDWPAALMVDGVVYVSTGEEVSAEVDPGVIRVVSSYTGTMPTWDGQANFDRDLSCQYAVTSVGLLVKFDHEWVRFEPLEEGES